ncbi:hypothetical protein AB870_12360 [Pandoraea faecigallinarum]|uniref:Uncharacterized protein n=1 Tax=Pandoraea faecigallinarum TaxID=656179 RepID=A0A0H3WW36_9BURK|nr:hypothetical protein [Pandoraea faecigallinarum]AKM30731.1 hypothetical protein AB870_12360 [Pandoraea faecigallinarum]
MSSPVNVTPAFGRATTLASRRYKRVTRAMQTHDAAQECDVGTIAMPDEKSPRDSQTLSHANRTLAVRREPPRAPDIERYLRRWLSAPPAVLVTLASDDELLARNAAYPLLSSQGRRFGDIGFTAYVLTQSECGYRGTHLRTCIVSITQGATVVTFPALQAWADDGETIVRADALSHLHHAAERLKATSPVQSLRRQDFYQTEMLCPPPHPTVVQSTHRIARLGMWLAATALLERGSTTLEKVLRDIRIGSTKFDPTFRQHQELARLARARNRRPVARSAENPDALDAPEPSPASGPLDAHDSEIASPSLSRTFHDARSAHFSQRCR